MQSLHITVVVAIHLDALVYSTHSALRRNSVSSVYILEHSLLLNILILVVVTSVHIDRSFVLLVNRLSYAR